MHMCSYTPVVLMRVRVHSVMRRAGFTCGGQLGIHRRGTSITPEAAKLGGRTAIIQAARGAVCALHTALKLMNENQLSYVRTSFATHAAMCFSSSSSGTARRSARCAVRTAPVRVH